MQVERMKFPDLWKSSKIEGFGEITVVPIGWKQLRRYGNHRFHLKGIGSGPTNEVIDTWKSIELKLDAHLKMWHDEVEKLAAQPHGYPVDQKYLNCIRKALDTNTLSLNEIRIIAFDEYEVVFEFPEHWDFYVWPMLLYQSGSISDSFFAQ